MHKYVFIVCVHNLEFMVGGKVGCGINLISCFVSTYIGFLFAEGMEREQRRFQEKG